jgi:transposase
VTFEARDGREILRASGSFPTDAGGCRLLIRYARQWPDRIWAVEGANGIGRPLAQRLIAAGERVLDVPAKLAARARVSGTGQGRETDAADAHAIVMVALRDKKLREVSLDPELAVLRLLCDRRDELSKARAQALNRMHRLFPGLVPGGAPVKKSASQYKKLLASVRPDDPVGTMRRRMAAEELADAGRLDASLKAMKGELKTAVLATGSHLMDIHGIGPAGAARILADAGDIRRFPRRSHFASWTGTAPIDASSGQHIRHRLSRAGNRRINHVLYMAGLAGCATTPQAAATTAAASPTARPRWKPCDACAAACRRRLPSARPGRDRQGRPGRALGASLTSSAADLTPVIGSSDQPLPGPAQPTLLPLAADRKTAGPGAGAPPRRRARGVNVERPAGRTTLTPTSAVAPWQASRTSS